MLGTPESSEKGPGGCPVPPAPTCAAARTFWFKLLPWRGSGGPENTADTRRGGWGMLPGGAGPCSWHSPPSRSPSGVSSPLPAASRMKLAFLFSCRTNWGEPWEQVCSRIFSTWLGGQGQVTAALPGAGGSIPSPPQCWQHGPTFSLTWQELLCSRVRRCSSRHWLLPGDSWEISRDGLGIQPGSEGAAASRVPAVQPLHRVPPRIRSPNQPRRSPTPTTA